MFDQKLSEDFPADFSDDEALVQSLFCPEPPENYGSENYRPENHLEVPAVRLFAVSDSSAQAISTFSGVERSRYHRLVAFAVVSERKARDLARRNIAVQSLGALCFAAISPLMTAIYLHHVPLNELGQIYEGVVAVHEGVASSSNTLEITGQSSSFSPEQDLVDQLLVYRQKLARSLPVMASASTPGLRF